MIIAGLAVIGAKNNPLVIKSVDGSSGAQLQELVHSSLDAFEERVTRRAAQPGAAPAAGAPPGSGAPQEAGTSPSGGAPVPPPAADCYLGLLYQLDSLNLKIYGYITNTFVKIVMLVRESPPGMPPREELIVKAMRCIHSEVSDALCNPFYVSGSPITSPGFYSRVGNILTAMTPPPPAVM